MTTPDTRPYTYDFVVSREATDTITAMREHVIKLRDYYGATSKEYLEASPTFWHNLAMMFGRPMADRTSVSRDGHLSLVVTSGITYGMIWHGRRRHCTSKEDGCKAQVNDDGQVWVYSPGDIILDHEHQLSYALDAPQPGSWSFHS